jgi:tRNA-binding protein
MSAKPITNYSSFAALDIRVGKILAVEDARTKKPTYRLTVDFGPEIGVKKSCGAYKNYSKEFLLGNLVVGVLNFGPKQMGPELSEVLILGVPNPNGDTIFLMPQQEVGLGVEVF